MSKVIYLYNQDNSLSTNDKLYEIILNFFKSISTNLIIIFFNYFFNDSLEFKDSINVSSKTLNKNQNNYVPLNYSLPAINFITSNGAIYSVEFSNNTKNNFSLFMLKYSETSDDPNAYSFNMPEAKILEFENAICTPDKFNYSLKICQHTLSYEIPVYNFSRFDADFIKENNLYALIPFSLFKIYHLVSSNSKIDSNTDKLQKQILNLSQETYKIVKELSKNNSSLNKKDYSVIKDTIGEITDYYLELLEI